MATRTRSAIIVAVLITLPIAQHATTYDESEEAWETYLDLRIIDTVLMDYVELRSEFDIPEKWVPMKTFAKGFPNAFASKLPTRDAWGREYMVGCLVDYLIVASSGEDGIADAVELFENIDLDHLRPGYINEHLHDDMMLWVGSQIVNSPRTTFERLNAAVADLRSIGTAVESYAIDNDLYPVQMEDLQDLTGLEAMIEPIYIRTLPKQDPWGNDFLYWSDAEGYILISMGADGLLDRPYSLESGALEPTEFIGEFEDPRTDIIFVNGQFVQWPQRENDP